MDVVILGPDDWSYGRGVFGLVGTVEVSEEEDAGAVGAAGGGGGDGVGVKEGGGESL